MTLDASGNLLVGNTAQSATANRVAVFSANKFGLSVIDTTAQATGVGGALNLGGNYRTTGDAQAFCRVEAAKENSTDSNFAYAMAFSTTPNGGTFTERARITSGGDLLVGTMVQLQAANSRLNIEGDFYNACGVSLKTNNAGSGSQFIAFLNESGTLIGSINRVTTTNAVVYNTTSDERLKSNIEDAAPVLDKLMAVKVRQYDWTIGGVHQDYGFVAQELEPILSGVVTKGKNEDDVWQLDYSKLTPHLVKALQEAMARIETLEAKIAALEAK